MLVIVMLVMHVVQWYQPSARQGSLESFPVRIHAPWAQALHALPPERMGGGIALGEKTSLCGPILSKI